MKRSSLLIASIVALFMIVTSCVKVPAGYVGVKVSLYGGEKGVNNKVVSVGRYWKGVNNEYYNFPTYQVNYVYTKSSTEGSPDNEEFTFQTKEGMECSMDMGVAMHFNPDLISKMFQTYHKGENEIRGTVVRNELRNNLNKIGGTMPIESVYGEGKALLIDNVKKASQLALVANGIEIDNIYLIGSIRIPESVKNALDAKVTMTQDAQKSENELRNAEAQAKIKVVNAEAEAEANKVISASITPTLVQWKIATTWDGHLPYVSGSGSLVQLPLPTSK